MNTRSSIVSTNIGVNFINLSNAQFYTMKAISSLAMVLLVVGGLNWGLVGLLDMNLVTMIFGSGSMLTNTVYDLVGVSAIWVAYKHWM